MATNWSGVGGKLAVGSGTPVNLDVIDWSLDKSCRLAETTHANGGGNASFIAGVKEYSGSATVVWDSEATPEEVIDIGTSVTLKLYLGNSTKFYSITALIEKLSPKVNARAEAINYQLQWKGTGAMTNPVPDA